MVLTNLESRSNLFFHLACVSAGGPYKSPRTLALSARSISIYSGWYEILRLALACVYWWTIWVLADTCRQGGFLSTSVDMKYCGWIRSICTLKSIFNKFCYHFFYKFLIVGSSAPPYLLFGILRFRTNIWHFIQAFW